MDLASWAHCTPAGWSRAAGRGCWAAARRCGMAGEPRGKWSLRAGGSIGAASSGICRRKVRREAAVTKKTRFIRPGNPVMVKLQVYRDTCCWLKKLLSTFSVISRDRVYLPRLQRRITHRVANTALWNSFYFFVNHSYFYFIYLMCLHNKQLNLFYCITNHCTHLIFFSTEP